MTTQAVPPLIQTGSSGQRRRFEFIGDRRLRISERSRRESRSYMIDVIAIDPNGRTAVYVPWNWLALVLAGAAAASTGWLAPGPGRVSLAVALLICAAASLAGVVMMIRGTSRRRIFLSCHARLPLLDLALNQPNPDRFSAFVDYLEESIANARQQRKLEKHQHVAGEMRTLRRLSKAGVLAPETYQRARNRLLRKF